MAHRERRRAGVDVVGIDGQVFPRDLEPAEERNVKCTQLHPAVETGGKALQSNAPARSAPPGERRISNVAAARTATTRAQSPPRTTPYALGPPPLTPFFLSPMLQRRAPRHVTSHRGGKLVATAGILALLLLQFAGQRSGPRRCPRLRQPSMPTFTRDGTVSPAPCPSANPWSTPRSPLRRCSIFRSVRPHRPNCCGCAPNARSRSHICPIASCTWGM